MTGKPCRLALWLVLVGVALVRSAMAADPESEASKELELRFQLAPATRLFVLTSLTRNNFSSTREISLGIAIDRKISSSWSYRAGLRQIGTSEDEDRSVERRAVVDMTYRRPLGAKWTLYNRGRSDLRWVESKPFSYRLRDRLMLERSARIHEREITWYASYEVYFDSRYDELSRERGIIGFSVPINRVAAVDFYGSRSHERSPGDGQTNSIGFVLTLSFGKPEDQAIPTVASWGTD